MLMLTGGRGPGILHYGWHFGVLTCIAAVLVAVDHWRPLHGAVANAGLYGVLHSSALVVSLRASQQLRRMLLFIAIAASFAMLSALLALHGGRLVAALPGMAGPMLLLSLASGLGAASYAILIRRFWAGALSSAALIYIAVGCVLSALALMTAAMLGRSFGGLWFAICWWFAFSTGLYFHDGRHPHIEEET